MTLRRRLVRTLSALAAAAVVVPLAQAPAGAAPARIPDRFGAPVYLALGDSVAAGVGAVPKVSGYPELTLQRLSGYNTAAGRTTPGATSSLGLSNISVGGATTTTLLSGQLPKALALIAARQADRDPFNDVELITVTIGGNDVFQPVVGTCVTFQLKLPCQGTTDAALGQLSQNLTSILTQLTSAAGRGTEVVVTTYYNPIGSCALAAVPRSVQVAEVALEGGTIPGLLTLSAGVNDVIRAAAAASSAQVAELYGAVVAGQFVGGLDCLHPNQAGHTAIAQVVASQVGR